MEKQLVITCLAITLVLSFGFYQSFALETDERQVESSPLQVISRNIDERSDQTNVKFGQPLPGTLHISDVPKGAVFCPQISH